MASWPLRWRGTGAKAKRVGPSLTVDCPRQISAVHFSATGLAESNFKAMCDLCSQTPIKVRADSVVRGVEVRFQVNCAGLEESEEEVVTNEIAAQRAEW